jgi:hypothetical protein
MVTLLLVNGLFAFLAINRGWRWAPVFLAGLPWLIHSLEGPLSNVTVGGWWLPFSNLLFAASAFSTLGLLFTLIVEPERA